MNWLFLPHWSSGILLGAWALLCALAVVRYLRERRACRERIGLTTLFLRCAGLTGLLLIALNPTGLLQKTQPGKPRLAVMLDNSSSMLVRDCAGVTRLQSAEDALRSARDALEKDFEVAYYSFAANVRRSDGNTADGSGRASDPGRAVLDGVEAVAPAGTSGASGRKIAEPAAGGVVLLTDGRATTGGTLAAARHALARSVPLWPVPLGGEVERRDLRIATVASEVPAFSGEEVELSARLYQQGYPGRSFQVELLRDESVEQRFEVIPDPSGKTEIRARVRAPESGEARYSFRVPVQPDEADAGNNELPVYVRAGAQKARVLLVEGQPHWDSKFLVQHCKRDERVEITALYRLGKDRVFAVLPGADSRLQERDGLFPDSAAAFAKYDVIILGKDCEAFFQPQTAPLLVEYVAGGGTVIFARGHASGTELARLEPLVFEGNEGQPGRLRLLNAATEAGILSAFNRENSETASGAEDPSGGDAAKLPELDQVMPVAGLKPLAGMLAMSGQTPVLAWQRYGQGRTCQLNMGGLWRWGFRGPEEERLYAEFWRSLLRWLMSGDSFRAGDSVALISQRRVYTEDESPQFIVKTRNLNAAAYHPQLRIESVAGVEELPLAPLPAGVLGARGKPLPPGACRAVLRSNIGEPAEIVLNFRIVSSSVENNNLSADPALLRQIAEVSGGRTLVPEELSGLGDIYRRYAAGRSLGEDKIPLWDRWWILGALALLFGLEWYLRRREGVL